MHCLEADYIDNFDANPPGQPSPHDNGLEINPHVIEVVQNWQINWVSPKQLLASIISYQKAPKYDYHPEKEPI